MKRNIILARGCCSIYRKKESEGNFIMQSVPCARGPGFDPRRRRGKFVGPNLLLFVSFAGMIQCAVLRIGTLSPVQVKDPYTGSILMHVQSIDIIVRHLRKTP